MHRRIALRIVVVAVLAAGCASDTGEVAEFGPTADQPGLPDDGVVDVHAVEPPDEVPARDARLAPGGWEHAAAFVAREAEAGRPTLVNIFASWCSPCRAEMPLLIEAHRANDDVAFLGIDHIDRLEDGEDFVEEFGVPYATLHDIDGDVAMAVGSRGMPTTVAFDRDGRLVARVVGELTETSLRGLLEEARG